MKKTSSKIKNYRIFWFLIIFIFALASCKSTPENTAIDEEIAELENNETDGIELDQEDALFDFIDESTEEFPSFDTTIEEPIISVDSNNLSSSFDNTIEGPIETVIDSPIEGLIDEPREAGDREESIETVIEVPVESSIESPIDEDAFTYIEGLPPVLEDKVDTIENEKSLSSIQDLERTPIQIPSPRNEDQLPAIEKRELPLPEKQVEVEAERPLQQESASRQTQSPRIPEKTTEPFLSQEPSSFSPETIERAIPEVREKPSPTKADVKNNQFIEIAYPGSAWIYIGEEGNENFVSYIGRKNLDGKTIFTLKTQKPGLTRLEFYKSDPLSQTYLEDSIELSISDEIAVDSEKKIIDSFEYKDALTPPQKEIAAVQTKASEVSARDAILKEQRATSMESTRFISEPELEEGELLSTIEQSSDMILASAKEAIANDKIDEALALLDEFLRVSLKDSDEAWFLRGQLYEKPGRTRNIRLARESYQTIIDAYPSSRFSKPAQDRIMYINKFFFVIQ